MQRIKHILQLGAVGASLVVLFGFGQALLPVFNSLSMFRLHFAIIFAVLCLLLAFWNQRWMLGVPLAAALYTFHVMPSERVAAKGGLRVTHWQHNADIQNDGERVAAHLRANTYDVVTLQEVTKRSRRLLQALRNIYPTQIYCDANWAGKVAILSPHPLEELAEPCRGSGLVTGRLSIHGQKLTVVSLHLHWPWPMAQTRRVTEHVLPHLQSLKPPLLIGGDFNATAWSHNVRKIEKATGTTAQRGAWTTYSAFGLVPLAIDHSLRPKNFQFISSSTLERGSLFPFTSWHQDRLGSDHWPMQITYKWQ